MITEEKMRKIKRCFATIVATALAVVLIVGTGCLMGCGGSKKIVGIDVDTSSARTTYSQGDEFTSAGIVVSQLYSDGSLGDAITSFGGGYSVDSSAYNRYTPGSYEIIVSATINETEYTESYTVKVVEGAADTLKLDLSGVKTEYTVPDSFTAEGLKGEVTYANGYTNSLTNSDMIIDSSNFRYNRSGTYTITAVYESNGRTAIATYDVTVTDPKEVYTDTGIDVYVTDNAESAESGEEVTDIDVTLPSGCITENGGYNLSQDISGLKVVYRKDAEKDTAEGESSESSESSEVTTLADESTSDSITTELSPKTDNEDGYTLKYYHNGEEISDLENIYEDGIYQIWALYDVTIGQERVTLSNFVRIYVLDTAASISENEQGTYSQEGSYSDEMSPTWSYTVTFLSGAKKTITAGDVVVTKGNTTVQNEEGEKYSSTVSYTYINAKGQATDPVTCTVEYTITSTLVSYDLNITELFNSSALAEQSYSDDVYLSDTFTIKASSSGTVSVNSNSKSIDGFSFSYRLQLGGAGKADYRSIQITVTGACTIRVYGMSSSSGTSRTLQLYDGEWTALDDTGFVNDGASIGSYEFTLEAAGTYYLASTSGGFNIYMVSVVY